MTAHRPADTSARQHRRSNDGEFRRRILITAGPTQEPIDAVRYIGNRSSGRLGIALADAAAGRGWTATLLLGPTCRAPSDSRVRVEQCHLVFLRHLARDGAGDVEKMLLRLERTRIGQPAKEAGRTLEECRERRYEGFGVGLVQLLDAAHGDQLPR